MGVDGNYIKISRKILEWEWYSDINTYRLFTHMLLRANWRDGKFKGTTIPRGSFVSSINTLSKETGLTEREIRTAISHLKATGEVTSKSTNKYTVFRVNNYDTYQANDKQIDTQETSERRPNDILTTTIEEGKKERREYIKDIVAPLKSEPATFLPEAFEMCCVNKLIKSCLDNYPNSKVPQTDAEKQAWCIHIERMQRLDGRTQGDIETALNYAIKDSFWQSNIRSAKKFREKFETLLIQSKQKKQQPSAKPNQFHNFNQRDTDYNALVMERLKERFKGREENQCQN